MLSQRHPPDNHVAKKTRRLERVRRYSVLVLAGCLLGPALAMDVWSEAARTSGVPVHVLHGIALTESGKVWTDGSTRPWPWTLNSPVKGRSEERRVGKECRSRWS